MRWCSSPNNTVQQLLATGVSFISHLQFFLKYPRECAKSCANIALLTIQTQNPAAFHIQADHTPPASKTAPRPPSLSPAPFCHPSSLPFMSPLKGQRSNSNSNLVLPTVQRNNNNSDNNSNTGLEWDIYDCQCRTGIWPDVKISLILISCLIQDSW